MLIMCEVTISQYIHVSNHTKHLKLTCVICELYRNKAGKTQIIE